MAESIKLKDNKFIDSSGVFDTGIANISQARINQSLASADFDKSTGQFGAITSLASFWACHERNMHPITLMSSGRGRLGFTLDGIVLSGWYRWKVSSQNPTGTTYGVDGIVTFYGNGSIYRFYIAGTDINALTASCIEAVKGGNTGKISRAGTAYNAKYKSGGITYIVRNGICYVSLNAVYFTDQTSGRVEHYVTGFPKVLNDFVSYASMAGGALTGEIFAYGGNTSLCLRTIGTGALYGTMSYIVDFG